MYGWWGRESSEWSDTAGSGTDCSACLTLSHRWTRHGDGETQHSSRYHVLSETEKTHLGFTDIKLLGRIHCCLEWNNNRRAPLDQEVLCGARLKHYLVSGPFKHWMKSSPISSVCEGLFNLRSIYSAHIIWWLGREREVVVPRRQRVTVI